MSFGLANAQATFMTLLDSFLWPYLEKIMVVFLENILIYSDTQEENYQHRKVLDLLHKHKLFVKQSKCNFL